MNATRTVIREKANFLKSLREDVDLSLNKTYAPLIKGLKNISTDYRSDNNTTLLLAPKSEKKNLSKEFPNKKEYDDDSTTLFGTPDGNSTMNKTKINRQLFIDEDFDGESSKTMSPTELNTNSLLSKHAEKVKYNNNLMDFSTGLRKDMLNWKIGNTDVKFTNNYIHIGNDRFKVTEGLCQLLFYRDPAPTFTDSDLKNYKKILVSTGAHLKASGQIKSNRGSKYNHIIGPMFKEHEVSKGNSSLTGSGFKKYKQQHGFNFKSKTNNCLVRRLRILYAAKRAGHNNVCSEIENLINELRARELLI